jgi:outer membrane protein assembly factor BamB
MRTLKAKFMHKDKLPKLLVVTLLAVTLASCSIFKSGKKDIGDPLLGERLPVLTFEQGLEVDQALSSIPVALPPPFTNMDWAQAGGASAKSIQHLSLGEHLRKVWSTNVGEGDSKSRRIVASPIVIGSHVFTMDAAAVVTSLDTKSGRKTWSHELRRKGDKKNLAFGGGVGGADGKLYATTGFGIVVALDAESGNELWRKDIGAPLRGAPAIAGAHVYVMTQDNVLYALSADKGDEVWNAPAISENAGILGSAAPAISGDTLVVGYSSGELNALRAENGHVTWQDTLARTGRLTALSTLTDIDGSPVIDRGRVFAIGHGGRMVALELTTGERVWEKSIGGLSTPWVAGDYVFVVTTDSQLICLLRRDGKVRWMTELQHYEKPGKKKGLVRWEGPLLASDRLILTSSNGYVISVSPYTGKILGAEKIGDGTYLSPIIANNTLYVMTQDAKLIAYR